MRYVLEGSVQHWGKQVRVNVQLVDAETDAHIWAERFDHDTSDLGALQSEITDRIAVALDAEVTSAELPGRASIPTRWSTFSGPVLHYRNRHRRRITHRRSPFTSAHWSSIRALSQPRAGWQPRS